MADSPTSVLDLFGDDRLAKMPVVCACQNKTRHITSISRAEPRVYPTAKRLTFVRDVGSSSTPTRLERERREQQLDAYD